PTPNGPNPASTELTIDFSEFAGGDTITTTHGVGVSLAARGELCADAIIAFDSSVPRGVQGDDLDLGTPNQTFGGPGVGVGGEAGPFQNDRPLGNVLVIQEDPTLEDDNPDPQDDCVSGGTIVFDFSQLSATGVKVTAVTVIDVDDTWQARSQFRLYGERGGLLKIFRPPVTGPNGVATMDFDVSGVLRMEVEERISIGIARILIEVPNGGS
ncbi:MAG TPA: hypothetical protein VJP59_00910, partial [Gemmatimonadota bacterium]|nr:hypothetical protein [Gemmatimonadota bacterium]